jgi:hypothetical protein
MRTMRPSAQCTKAARTASTVPYCCSGLGLERYKERLKELGMTTLQERRHHLDLLQTRKILHDLDRVDRKKNFVSHGK